jgi:hypothetical protein
VQSRDLRAPKAVPAVVEEAVKRDLKAFPADLARSTLAESALALARELDSPENSATSKSMCARALLDTMNRLRELAPPPEQKDRLDDLSARRQQRKRRAAAKG